MSQAAVPFLSESSLDRLRRALRRECKARAVADETLDVENIRRQIKKSAGGLITGLIAFSRACSLTNTLYAKLEQLRAERDRLRAQLDTAERQKAGTARQEFKEVEEAISVLADLQGAFEKADPAETRNLLTSLVSRIDLFFDRHQHGKYTRTTFRERLIHVRPDPTFTNLSTMFHCKQPRMILAIEQRLHHWQGRVGKKIMPQLALHDGLFMVVFGLAFLSVGLRSSFQIAVARRQRRWLYSRLWRKYNDRGGSRPIAARGVAGHVLLLALRH